MLRSIRSFVFLFFAIVKGEPGLAQEKKKKGNWRGFLLRFLTGLFICILILTGAAVVLKKYFMTRENTRSHPFISNIIPSLGIIPGENTFPSDKRNLYVLVVGLDNNWTEQDIVYTKGARTDTIMLVNFNLDKKTAGVLSIPRDSRVYIPGYYEEKINSAYSLGGIELAMKTVSEVFKIPVDYYIVVRTQALPKLVDALGGIETYVEKDMDYDDNWGHLHIHLKEGWQTIDGDRAVQYSRFRKDDEGDLGRIRRQQQVIYAVKSKASKIAGINELRNLIQTVLENVDTNFSTTELMALANIYKHMNMKDVKMGTIPTYGDDSSGVSYQIIDETQLQAYIDEYLMGKIPEPSVEILNGSTEVGIAKKLEEQLVSIGGFKITEVKNADRDDYETSQIIINSTKLDAQSVAGIVALIGKPEILSNPSEASGTSDITIILGKDYAKICSSDNN